MARKKSMQEIATKYTIRNVSQVKAWGKKIKAIIYSIVETAKDNPPDLQVGAI